MKPKYTKCEGCGQRDYKETPKEIVCNYCGLMYDKPVEVRRSEFIGGGFALGTAVCSTVAMSMGNVSHFYRSKYD